MNYKKIMISEKWISLYVIDVINLQNNKNNILKTIQMDIYKCKDLCQLPCLLV